MEIKTHNSSTTVLQVPSLSNFINYQGPCVILAELTKFGLKPFFVEY